MSDEHEALRARVAPVMIDFHRIVSEAARGMTAETLDKVAPLFERAAMLAVAEAQRDVLVSIGATSAENATLVAMRVIEAQQDAEALVAEVQEAAKARQEVT